VIKKIVLSLFEFDTVSRNLLRKPRLHWAWD